MTKIAFVFPGQGSQYVGMGKDFSFSGEIFEKANNALGFDLKKICFEGPEEKLKLTEITQPAILTVSYICFKALQEKGIHPQLLAGHSLGEYSALCASGSLKFEDAVRLVSARGKFMQEAVPVGEGAMSAIIGLDRDTVISCCKKVQGDVSAANFNSPGQVVISGKKEAVEEAGVLCKEVGAKRVLPLPVSAPFHSSLMAAAAERLSVELDKIEIKNAQVPVVSNVLAEPVADSAKIKELLIKQVTASVLWEDSVERMIKEGVSVFIEVGPKKVLAGLIKKIDPGVNVFGVEDQKSLGECLNEIKG